MRLGRFFTRRLNAPGKRNVTLRPGVHRISSGTKSVHRRDIFSFPGGHGDEVTPVPIPNTEVKGIFGKGTTAVGRGRVARRRGIFFNFKFRDFRFFGRNDPTTQRRNDETIYRFVVLSFGRFVPFLSFFNIFLAIFFFFL